jgi:hypothetical protein
MRITLGIIFAFLFLISVVTGAQRVFAPGAPPAPLAPNELLLAGERLKLDPPAGFCVLDSNRDNDGRLLKAMQQRSPANFVVIRGFVSCDQLIAVRSGTFEQVESFGAISVKQEQGRVVTAGGRTRADYLRAVEESSPKVDVDQISRDMAGRLADVHGSANISSASILKRDDVAVYAGAVAQLQLGGIETRPYLYVGAITLVGSVPLIVAVTHIADGTVDIRDLLSSQVQYQRFLFQANSQLNASAPSRAMGITTYSAPIYVGDVMLLLSAIGLVAVFAWPRRRTKEQQPQQSFAE